MSNKDEAPKGTDPRKSMRLQAEFARERQERSEKGPLEAIRARTQAADAARVAEAATHAAMIANPGLFAGQIAAVEAQPQTNTTEGEQVENGIQSAETITNEANDGIASTSNIFDNAPIAPIAPAEPPYDTPTESATTAPAESVIVTPTENPASFEQSSIEANADSFDDDTVLADTTATDTAIENGNLEMPDMADNVGDEIVDATTDSDNFNTDNTAIAGGNLEIENEGETIANDIKFTESTESPISDMEPELNADAGDSLDAKPITEETETKPIESEQNAEQSSEALDDDAEFRRIVEKRIGILQLRRQDAVAELEKIEAERMEQSSDDNNNYTEQANKITQTITNTTDRIHKFIDILAA